MLFSNILCYNKLCIIRNCQNEKSNSFSPLGSDFSLFPQIVTITQTEAFVKYFRPPPGGILS